MLPDYFDVSMPLRAGALTVDLDRYEAAYGDRALALTALQLELLAVFASRPGAVWSRERLGLLCWDDADVGRRLDVALSRIRAELGVVTFRNVRGRGWQLALP